MRRLSCVPDYLFCCAVHSQCSEFTQTNTHTHTHTTLITIVHLFCSQQRFFKISFDAVLFFWNSTSKIVPKSHHKNKHTWKHLCCCSGAVAFAGVLTLKFTQLCDLYAVAFGLRAKNCCSLWSKSIGLLIAGEGCMEEPRYLTSSHAVSNFRSLCCQCLRVFSSFLQQNGMSVVNKQKKTKLETINNQLTLAMK